MWHQLKIAGIVGVATKKTGERLACAGWEFEVVDLDGRRIDKVLARPLPTGKV